MDMQRPPTFTIGWGQQAPAEARERALVIPTLKDIRDYIFYEVTPPLTPYLARIPIVHVSQDWSPSQRYYRRGDRPETLFFLSQASRYPTTLDREIRWSEPVGPLG